MRLYAGFCFESHVKLCGPVWRYCARISDQGKQNLEATAAKPINRCNKKVTELLLTAPVTVIPSLAKITAREARHKT
jgi:hypothetical protein